MHHSNTNQWQNNNNNNVSTTNVSDQIDSVHSSNLSAESVLNKMASNEISQMNELTLGTSSSGSSVSQNDNINATLMSNLNIQSIDNNLADKLCVLGSCDSLIVNPSHFIEVLLK